MNCLIILLLLCCCGNSNNHVCCENSCDCNENCNENTRENECYDEVRYERSYDNDRADSRNCNFGRDCDSCDDYDRDRRDNSWKEYSDFRRNNSCGCDNN